MKTKQEIKALFREWCDDPCWDLEEAIGFEAHYRELKKMRLDYEAEQEEKRKKERRIIAEVGDTGSFILNSGERIAGVIAKIPEKPGEPWIIRDKYLAGETIYYVQTYGAMILRKKGVA